MSQDGNWADAIAIRAAAMAYGRVIDVYHSPNAVPVSYRPELDSSGDSFQAAVVSLAFVNVTFGFASNSVDHRGDEKQDHFVSLIRRSATLLNDYSLGLGRYGL
jgi:hypothetical protein